MLGLFGVNQGFAQAVDCAGGSESVEIVVGADVFDGEVAWEVVEAGLGVQAYENTGGGLTENTTLNYNLPVGNYNVYGYDSFGDNWNGFSLEINRGALNLLPNSTNVAGPGNGNAITTTCGSAAGNPFGQGNLLGSFALQPLVCTIACPADITVSTDPGICEALNVTVPDPVVENLVPDSHWTTVFGESLTEMGPAKREL